MSRFVSLPTGGELLAGPGDERRAHGAALSALLPAGVGTSCCGHRRPGRGLAWRIRMVDTRRVRAGARRRVSRACSPASSTVWLCERNVVGAPSNPPELLMSRQEVAQPIRSKAHLSELQFHLRAEGEAFADSLSSGTKRSRCGGLICNVCFR